MSNTKNKISVFDVANYFILKGIADEDFMTHLKVQKLVYYSQGFFLAMYGEPLFKEKLLAWEHGPVSPDLYSKLCGYRGEPITDTIGKYDESIYNLQVQELLDEVYNVYAQYSAWKLRNLTHEEPPWKDTPRDHVISYTKMKEYFKKQLVDA